MLTYKKNIYGKKLNHFYFTGKQNILELHQARLHYQSHTKIYSFYDTV